MLALEALHRGAATLEAIAQTIYKLQCRHRAEANYLVSMLMDSSKAFGMRSAEDM